MPYILAVVSDLHVNSTTALAAPSVNLDDGGYYKASKLQLWIWNRWKDYWSEVERYADETGYKVVSIFNGELGDDLRHKSSQMISKNPADIMRHSRKVLERPVSLSDAVYVTRGTEAHSGVGSWVDEAIAEQIEAVEDPAAGTSSRYHLVLTLDGVRIDAAHHPKGSYARGYTKGNSANRNAYEIQNSYYGRGLQPPHLAFRGHVHRPEDSGDNHHTRFIVTPSWQLTNSFGWRIGGGWLPVGGVIVIIEGDDYKVIKPSGKRDRIYYSFPIKMDEKVMV